MTAVAKLPEKWQATAEAIAKPYGFVTEHTLGKAEALSNCADELTAALSTQRAAEADWLPIESAPKDAPYWLVWSAYYQRPVVVTQRRDDNTYWEGDWDFDVQATHWTASLTPPSAKGES